MLKSETTCLINAVHIGEATIHNLANAPILEGTYALCSAENGARFGRGTRNVWSEETQQKLADLLESMERDVIRDLFESDGGAVAPAVPDSPDGVPGIGEEPV